MNILDLLYDLFLITMIIIVSYNLGKRVARDEEKEKKVKK
jgi:hypothetical protein